jgi:hypothetical protein
LGRDLTQGSLKSLSLPTIFQAEDEGSIPFTRSNLFNDLVGDALGIVSRRAVALCHGAAISDCFACRESLLATIALAASTDVVADGHNDRDLRAR